MRAYLLRNVDDEFWVNVKILATKKKGTIGDLIVGLLTDEITADLERYKKELYKKSKERRP